MAVERCGGAREGELTSLGDGRAKKQGCGVFRVAEKRVVVGGWRNCSGLQGKLARGPRVPKLACGRGCWWLTGGRCRLKGEVGEIEGFPATSEPSSGACPPWAAGPWWRPQPPGSEMALGKQPAPGLPGSRLGCPNYQTPFSVSFG